jgi:hypothetical protein
MKENMKVKMKVILSSSSEQKIKDMMFNVKNIDEGVYHTIPKVIFLLIEFNYSLVSVGC